MSQAVREGVVLSCHIAPEIYEFPPPPSPNLPQSTVRHGHNIAQIFNACGMAAVSMSSSHTIVSKAELVALRVESAPTFLSQTGKSQLDRSIMLGCCNYVDRYLLLDSKLGAHVARYMRSLHRSVHMTR